MKKITILSLILMLTVTSFAFAESDNNTKKKQSHEETYYNCPYPECPICNSSIDSKSVSMGEPVIMTIEQARNATEKYIKRLKGYYIETVEPFNRDGGGITAYKAYVKDSAGNNFFFYVDPWGKVVGPIYNKSKK